MSAARARMPSRRGRPEWLQPDTKVDEQLLETYVQGQNPGLATDQELDEVQQRLTRIGDRNTTPYANSRQNTQEIGSSESPESSVFPNAGISHELENKPSSRPSSYTGPYEAQEMEASYVHEMEGNSHHSPQEPRELDVPDRRGRSYGQATRVDYMSPRMTADEWVAKMDPYQASRRAELDED